jgi:hypothetical protein
MHWLCFAGQGSLPSHDQGSLFVWTEQVLSLARLLAHSLALLMYLNVCAVDKCSQNAPVSKSVLIIKVCPCGKRQCSPLVSAHVSQVRAQCEKQDLKGWVVTSVNKSGG